MSDKGENAERDARQKREPDAFRVIDRRHFLELDKLGSDVPVEEKPRYPSFVEEMLAKMELTERKFEERKAQMQDEIARTKARLESDFQRRVDAERQQIALPFIEVLDNLERAAASASQAGTTESLLKGVELIVSQFRAKLQMSGIESIPVLNQPFDPNLGQAVGMVAVADPAQDGMVVEELQRGYRMGEQLVRPAQVRVGHLQP